MEIQALVVVVDFEDDLDFIESKAAEIVLFVGIVSVAKVIENRNGFD
jgi:hypothetical protein